MRYHGIYFYKNGDQFEGFWQDDVKTGFGKLKLANGEFYEGNFKEGKK